MKNKTAIVLGASAGIGRAIAAGFAQEGANVIALARRLDRLESLADEVRSYGQQAHVRHLDVFDADAYPSLMRWLAENQLDWDVVVHTIGGGSKALSLSDDRLAAMFEEHHGKMPFWLLTDEDVDRVLTLGVKSCMSTCRYLLPRLMEKKGGSLIVIGSGAGKAGIPQRYADYSAEKGAVMAYVPAIAHELKPYNVAANCLMPGHTINSHSEKEGVVDPTILPPEAVVPAAVFLALQGADGVTGEWFDARAYKALLAEPA